MQLRWKTLTPGGEVLHLARSVLAGTNLVSLHSHDFMEIFWVEEGAGLQYFPEKQEPMGPGDLYIVRAGDTHAVAAAQGSRCVILNLAFPRDVMAGLVKRHFPDRKDLLDHRLTPPRFTLSEVQALRLTGMAEELVADPRSVFRLERFLMNVLHELFCRADSRLPGDLPDWLKQACLGIREPSNLQAGTGAFVRLAGRCPEHVSRATRQWLGQTPTDIVNEARMVYASRQLAMTELKITDISGRCGFESLTHFYKLFRKRYGVSPHRYRRRGLDLSGVPAGKVVMLVDQRETTG